MFFCLINVSFVLQTCRAAWGSLVCLWDIVCSPGHCLEIVTTIVRLAPCSWTLSCTHNGSGVARKPYEKKKNQQRDFTVLKSECTIRSHKSCFGCQVG